MRLLYISCLIVDFFILIEQEALIYALLTKIKVYSTSVFLSSGKITGLF